MASCGPYWGRSLTLGNDVVRRPGVSVIVVTYRSAAKVPSCLEAMLDVAKSHSVDTAEWIFVDNSETSEDFAWLSPRVRKLPQISLHAQPSNPGFAAACNTAATAATGDWVVFLNPDVDIHIEDFDEILNALLNMEPPVASAAIGQRTRGFKHQGISMSWLGWFLDRPSHPLEGARARLSFALGGTRLLGPSGGAGAYRRSVFLELGGFQEELFAWGEDAELAIRLSKLHMTCMPIDVWLPHKGGHTVATDPSATRFRDLLLLRNRIVIAAWHYPTWQRYIFAVTAVLIHALRAPSHARTGFLRERTRCLREWLTLVLNGRRSDATPDIDSLKQLGAPK